jgi:hypothetical protein
MPEVARPIPFRDRFSAALFLSSTAGFLGGLAVLVVLTWRSHRQVSVGLGLLLVVIVAVSAIAHQYTVRRLVGQGDNGRRPTVGLVLKGANPGTIAAAARQVGLPAVPVLLVLGATLLVFAVAFVGLFFEPGGR